MNRSLVLLTAAALCLVRCADSGGVTAAGNGDASEAGNAFISGVLVASASFARVALFPVAYDPVADSGCGCVAEDTADAGGLYNLLVHGTGYYNVLARSADSRSGVIIDSVAVGEDGFIFVPDDTLRPLGCTCIGLDSTMGVNDGYMYVPGSDIAARLDSAAVADGFIVLRDVPAGSRLRVRYRSEDGRDSLMYEHLQVSPGDTTHCPGPQCKRWSDTL